MAVSDQQPGVDI